MPVKGEKYHIVPFKDGWRVMADNGTYYSQKPLAKTRARAQQRALYAKQRKGEIFHGSGYSFITHGGRTDCVLKGSGWFGDILTIAKTAASAVVQRVAAVAKGIRNNYPPASRGVIAKNADGVVVGVKIRRQPIKSMINTALDYITKGRWSTAKRELSYDRMYHLGVILTLQMPSGATNDVLVEKNQVISVTERYTVEPDINYFVLPPPQPPVTLAQFLERAEKAGGPDYFKYDAFTNNCQMFVDLLLSANGINTPEAKAFVLQDAEALLRELPVYVSPVAKIVTNLAGLADVAIYGEGMVGGGKWKDALISTARELIPEAGADWVRDTYFLNTTRNMYPEFKAVWRRRSPQHTLLFDYWLAMDKASANIPEKQRLFNDFKDTARVMQARANAAWLARLASGEVSLSRSAAAAADAAGDVASRDDIFASRRAKSAGAAADEEEEAEEAVAAPAPVAAGPRVVRIRFPSEEDAGVSTATAQRNITRSDSASRVIPAPTGIGRGANVITMKPADFFEEHKKIVALLDGIADRLKKEAKEQSSEAAGWKRKLEAKTTRMHGGVRLHGVMLECDSDSESEDEGAGRRRMTKRLKGKGDGCMCGCGTVRGRFKSYLTARDIDPKAYLDAAKAAAKKTGYDPRALEFSDDDEHKLMIYDDAGRVRRFGRVGYGDFIIHSKSGAQSVADQKRARFRKSHMAIKGDWKKDKFSPNWLAINILW